jgi:hypothetical protein
MATINPTITQLEPQDGSIVKFVWVLTGTNDGAPVPFVQWADRSVQIGSTGDVFGGGTVLWEGSNDSGLTYGTLTDAQSAAISKTAITSPEQIVEITELARPRASVSVTSVTISLVVRRQQPLRT